MRIRLCSLLVLLFVPGEMAAGPFINPPRQTAGVTICASLNGVCPPANTVTADGVTIQVQSPGTTAYTNSWEFGQNSLSAFATATAMSPTALTAASGSIWITDPSKPLSGYVIGYAHSDDILTITAPGFTGQTGFVFFDIALDLRSTLTGSRPDSSFHFLVHPDGPSITYPDGPSSWQEQLCTFASNDRCGQFTVSTSMFGFTFGEPFSLTFEGSARTGSELGDASGISHMTAGLALMHILDSARKPVANAQIASALGGDYPVVTPEPSGLGLAGLSLVVFWKLKRSGAFMTRFVALALILCAGTAAMRGQEDARATALTPAQQQKIQQIVQSGEKETKVQAAAATERMSEVAKRIDRNLLSDRPDDDLHTKLSAELADAVVSLVRTALTAKLNTARDLVGVLTPEQKKHVLAELEKPGANPDLTELIGKAFAGPKK